MKVHEVAPDPDCGALTLDSSGRQGAEGTGVRCWP